MTELAREYGEGLYDLAVDEHLTDELLDQAGVLLTAFREQPDFLRLLSNRALGVHERLGILDETFRNRVHPYLLNFLKLLCQRDALHEYAGCVEAYTAHYDADHDNALATVTTAVPLKEDQRTALLERLKQMTGRHVRLTEKLDPTVVGGVLLEMDGKRWDNTLRKRLEDMRQVIAGA